MTLKKLLKQSGKTRSDIIKEVGCSQSYLSLVESGERSVGPRYLRQMAKALGVRPDQIRPDIAHLFQEEAAPNTLQSVNSDTPIQGEAPENVDGASA